MRKILTTIMIFCALMAGATPSSAPRKKAKKAKTINAVVDTIPDDWLEHPEGQREVYRSFLTTRLANSNIFTNHAITVRETL